MKTFQEFQKAVLNGEKIKFIQEAIADHRNSPEYKIACDADEYDAQRNVTINATVKSLYNISRRYDERTGRESMGVYETDDKLSSNHHIASNFYHRLNTERCTYSLGNGVSFENDGVKEKLGAKFDTNLSDAAYKALKHGVSFGFWNVDRLYVFPLTEFVPLIDESDGSLKAGIRFWSLDWFNRPVYAVLYEEDGYTKYKTQDGFKGLVLAETEEKRAYRQTVAHTDAGGDEIIGEGNYSALPIVPLYGNAFHQSTLVGMRAAIDSYDLIQSGFANDLADCAQIYWLIGNANGMNDDEVQHFMDRLRLSHVALADTENSSVTPYTQEPPYAAREAYLARIQASIYRDFGAFNPSDVAAGNITATQIRAAYQSQDEEADAFEYQIIEFVQQILALQNIEDTPKFTRNRVANESEAVNMVIAEAEYLDDEAVLELLPNITPDMKDEILARKEVQDEARFSEEDEMEQRIREIVQVALNNRQPETQEQQTEE